MLKVYGDIQSGNCYKVKLLLSFLDIEHEWLHVNILDGESQTHEFLKKNPNGKIPTVEFTDGRFLSESNAILTYFAEDTHYSSSDKFGRAKIAQWLFFEQYSHEPCIAVARFIQFYLGMPIERKAEYEALQISGNKALALINDQLSVTPYLVGEQISIADIALYAYTHVAHQGGFELALYPSIEAWCLRIKTSPGYIAMA